MGWPSPSTTHGLPALGWIHALYFGPWIVNLHYCLALFLNSRPGFILMFEGPFHPETCKTMGVYIFYSWAGAGAGPIFSALQIDPGLNIRPGN